MSGYWSKSLCSKSKGGRSFVCSSRAEVQPTLNCSAETFISVQYASPGRGEELVGVCGAVHVHVV